MPDFISELFSPLFKRRSNPLQTAKTASQTDAGYVYVVGIRELPGYYKIGKTVNPAKRLRKLDGEMPFSPFLAHLLQVEFRHAVERILHRHFRSHQLKKEWFYLTVEDLEWITNLSEMKILELVPEKELLDAVVGSARSHDIRVHYARTHFSFVRALLKTLHPALELWQYELLIEDIRAALWHRTTEKLKLQMDISNSEHLHDYLSDIALAYECIVKALSVIEFYRQHVMDFDLTRSIVQQCAIFVGEHAEKASQKFGIDIATGKPLLPSETGEPE